MRERAAKPKSSNCFELKNSFWKRKAKFLLNRAPMSPRILPLSVLVIATIFTSTNVARAELPPQVYADLKAKAPEFLEVEITRVALNKRDGENLRDISVFADAKVSGVTRSKSGVKVGDVISLRYMTFEVITPGFVGPGPIAQVEKGKKYQIWFKKAGGHFYAAALGRSVEAK